MSVCGDAVGVEGAAPDVPAPGIPPAEADGIWPWAPFPAAAAGGVAPPAVGIAVAPAGTLAARFANACDADMPVLIGSP